VKPSGLAANRWSQSRAQLVHRPLLDLLYRTRLMIPKYDETCSSAILSTKNPT
jgi:hypothetical protein